jgi:hypothetical protein
MLNQCWSLEIESNREVGLDRKTRVKMIGAWKKVFTRMLGSLRPTMAGVCSYPEKKRNFLLFLYIEMT